MVNNVAVLGASGSIGLNTADVIARNPDKYRLYAVAARRNVDAILAQCRAHRPEMAVLVEEAAAGQLRERLAAERLPTHVESGTRALETLATLPEIDSVMAGIVGAAGLAPTIAAARAGKRVMLANKESLVMTGPLFLSELVKAGGELLPVDSEHNALFQGMPGGYRAGARPAGVERLWLTCSGGPFRGRRSGEIESASPEEACAHPRWKMGRKISVDSATLMNKGLEIIEASYLYGMPGKSIRVVVHPQSMIHSLVEYVDGSFVAQLGQPDMRTPIACALAWPERIEAGTQTLDLTQLGNLTFEAPDEQTFPCLRLARQALEAAGTAPAVLNAANEVAVAAFLEERLPFGRIASVVEETLERIDTPPMDQLDTVLAVDALARRRANELVGRLGGVAA